MKKANVLLTVIMICTDLTVCYVGNTEIPKKRYHKQKL